MKNRNIFPNVDFLDKFTIHRFLATNNLSCIISVSCNKWNGLSKEELRAEHHQGDNGSRKKKKRWIKMELLWIPELMAHLKKMTCTVRQLIVFYY